MVDQPNMHYKLGDQDVAVRFVRYDIQQEARLLDPVRSLISKDLSEPYSIYVYRYFLFQWAEFCWMVWHSKRTKAATLTHNC